MSKSKPVSRFRLSFQRWNKALPQKDRFSTDRSRNHPNFTLSGEREKEPQAGCGGREERQKVQRGPETSS